MLKTVCRYGLRRLWFFAEDSGAGDGGTAGDSGADAGADGIQDGNGGEGEVFDPSTKLDTRVRAKYESQLPKELQKDDFRGIEDIGTLYKSYKDLKEKDKSALHIPTAESKPEDIKAFFTKIGMPDDPAKYDCMHFDDMADVIYEPTSQNFREAAFACGLTKGQATRMWANMAATIQGFVNVANSKTEELKKSYDARYSSLLEKEIPDETRRSAKIAEEKNSAKAFGEAAGLTAFFEASGLSYNPEFTHKLALWYQKVQPMTIFSGDGGSYVDRGLEGMYRN